MLTERQKKLLRRLRRFPAHRQCKGSLRTYVKGRLCFCIAGLIYDTAIREGMDAPPDGSSHPGGYPAMKVQAALEFFEIPDKIGYVELWRLNDLFSWSFADAAAVIEYETKKEQGFYKPAPSHLTSPSQETTT